MDPKFKQTVILIAEVLIPELLDKTSSEYGFIKSFKKQFDGPNTPSQENLKQLVIYILALSYVYNFNSFRNISYEKRKAFINKLDHFPNDRFVNSFRNLKSQIATAYADSKSEMNQT